MPAHRPKNRDKIIEMHILAIEKKPSERIPDGHAHVVFSWKGGARQWKIEGFLEPESAFLKSKHNWETHVSDLPQGPGDAVIKFLEWVQYLTENKPTGETEDSPKDTQEGSLPS